MSESVPAASYFIRVRGRVLGPYDLRQLQTLRQRGQFSRANEVSIDRQTWQSAAAIEGLLKGPDARPTAASAVDASINSTSPAAAPQPAPAASATWYYSVGQEKFGPVTVLELRAMVAGRQLMPADLVWQDGLPDWCAVGDVPELSGVAASSPDAAPAGPFDDWNERQILVDVPGMLGALHYSGLTAGLPIRTWITDRPLSLVWVQIVAFMFCYPLALALFYGNRETPILEAAGAISLYFAILGGAILHRCIRPEPIGLARILGVWFFTASVGVALVAILSVAGRFFPFLQNVFTEIKSENMAYRWLQWTLAVGLVEEAAKALPIIVIVCWAKPRLTPNSAAYLGCVSGLAFGATEAVLYSLSYINIVQLPIPAMSFGEYILVQVLRWISLPLLHAIWTGIASYLIALALLFPGARGTMTVMALALVSILHGTYDFFAAEKNSPALFAVAVVSLLLFVGYIRNQLPDGLFRSSQARTR